MQGSPCLSYVDFLQNPFIVGLIRGIVGLPIEHPFDVVKVRLQSFPVRSTPRVIIPKIYRTEGIAGFYSGIYASGTTHLLKQVYRQPTYLYLTQALVPYVGTGALNGIYFPYNFFQA